MPIIFLQFKGIKFMWDATVESLEQLKTKPGGGCILAHCMGLGKTLQVILLIIYLHFILTLPKYCVNVAIGEDRMPLVPVFFVLLAT